MYVISLAQMDPYVAQIIFEEAKRVSTDMTKAPPLLDTFIHDVSAAPTESEEII
jgi:hypothetical protein